MNVLADLVLAFNSKQLRRLQILKPPSLVHLFMIRVLHNFTWCLLKPSKRLFRLKHLFLQLFQLLFKHKVVVLDYPLPERVLLNARLQLDPLFFKPEVGFSQLVHLLPPLQVSLLESPDLVVQRIQFILQLRLLRIRQLQLRNLHRVFNLLLDKFLPQFFLLGAFSVECGLGFCEGFFQGRRVFLHRGEFLLEFGAPFVLFLR